MQRPDEGDDLGLRIIERSFDTMQVDAPWSTREERAFTWWPGWNQIGRAHV